MRSLAKPEVLETSALAALYTAMACFPRFYLLPRLNYPIWYLEAILFLGSIVLWAFVFAWYTQYSGRPVFTLSVARGPFVLATVTGLALAVLLRFLLDPMVKARTPEEFPLTVEQWGAMTLFSLAFTQLFLVFAPFAWLLRLIKRQGPAVILTVLFGVYVLIIGNYGSPKPMPQELWVTLLLVRLVVGLGSVFFFLRGGLLLVWWWSFLLQSRHLLSLASGS